jgi:hypothetical protein
VIAVLCTLLYRQRLLKTKVPHLVAQGSVNSGIEARCKRVWKIDPFYGDTPKMNAG